MMTQRERLASGYLYTDMDEGMPEEWADAMLRASGIPWP